MEQPNTQDHHATDYKISARLHSIEDDLAYFIYPDNNGNEEENVLTWPANKLPQELNCGDDAEFILDFHISEEKVKEREQKVEKEKQYAEMRSLLEQLVN